MVAGAAEAGGGGGGVVLSNSIHATGNAHKEPLPVIIAKIVRSSAPHRQLALVRPLHPPLVLWRRVS